MALLISKQYVVVLLIGQLLVINERSWTVQASDPDILTDFTNIKNSLIDGNFFTYTGMRGIFWKTIPTFNVTKASMAEFPALEGQGVSLAVLQYPAGGVNPPHTHPRASELLFVVGGLLEIGFVDTTGKLFNQTLGVGDMFVFPKGLVHYQFNPHPQGAATALSAFGSASSGTVYLPTTLFGTDVDDEILARSFKTDVGTIQKLRAGLAPKN